MTKVMFDRAGELTIEHVKPYRVRADRDLDLRRRED